MTFFTKSYYPYHEKVYIDAKGSSKAFNHLSALGPLLRYSKVEVIFSSICCALALKTMSKVYLLLTTFII